MYEFSGQSQEKANVRRRPGLQECASRTAVFFLLSFVYVHHVLLHVAIFLSPTSQSHPIPFKSRKVSKNLQHPRRY